MISDTQMMREKGNDEDSRRNFSLSQTPPPNSPHIILLETARPNITHTHTQKIVLLHLLRLQCQGDGFNDLIGLFNLSNICEMATVNVEQEIAEIAQLFEMDNISQDKSPEMERTTINLTETHLNRMPTLLFS